MANGDRRVVSPRSRYRGSRAAVAFGLTIATEQIISMADFAGGIRPAGNGGNNRVGTRAAYTIQGFDPWASIAARVDKALPALAGALNPAAIEFAGVVVRRFARLKVDLSAAIGTPSRPAITDTALSDLAQATPGEIALPG